MLRSSGRWLSLAILLLVPMLAQAAERSDLIGIPTVFQTREEDTLLDIARAYDLGYVEIRAANPGIDPWLPGAGRVLSLPTQHLLPDAPHRGIVINLAELRLYYFPPKGEPRTFPIGIGGEGKETPVGRTEIVRKQTHPTWFPTASERAEDPDLPTMVPPGPDNPMGDFALYLGWPGYAIHGSNKPYSIGRRDSSGCIRMYPEDIETLFKLVGPGTQVTVVDQPVKLGWSAGELYLEIHPDQADADSIEATGKPRSFLGVDADDLVIKAAGTQAYRLDWYTIHLEEAKRSGIVVQITRAASGY
ncbi:MAG TPA: L,D-transpeptidase family protein [Stellaceae bacterium]|nr:L,D-transpeptidase family protein [Stellaceae bacterium]